MVNVRFYGTLKSFGTQFQLDVKDTAEALKALFSQLPKLRAAMQHGFYKVRIGRQYLDNRYLEQGLFYRLKKGMTIHITPVVAGAKKAGVFQTIAGAVLTIVGIVMLYTPAAAYAPNVIGMGVAMMIGGVAQMLTPMPKMETGSGADKKQSTAFSNIQNMAAQGQPVPIAYGRIRCGSRIISQGVETYDAESESEKALEQTVGFSKG
ncbi:phage tail protein [Pasteurellaceae bacterium Orientalotternb1]|nr:phage tail protein [Pasteurellaceae bacterium Orientalotternb1]